MEELKGIKNGNCNRTACQKPGAIYYNHSTQKYYCEECADTINKHNRIDAMRLYGHALCTLNEPEPKADTVAAEIEDVPYSKHLLESESTHTITNPYAGLRDIETSQLTKKQRNAVIVPVRSEPKIGRNDVCPCGSTKRYKKCCLK